MNFANIFRRESQPSDKTFNTIERKLYHVHDKIQSFAAAVDMNYADHLEQIAFGDTWQSIPGADGVCQIECALPTKVTTLLNVVFKANSGIPTHFHEKQEETIFVVEGSIIDRENGTHVKAGQVYTIPIKQPHTIYSYTGALLNVLFKPKFESIIT